MVKVYCKNCIFDFVGDYGQWVFGQYCHKKKKKNKYNNQTVEEYIYYSENETGNCKFYKRKFWKFWVKDK